MRHAKLLKLNRARSSERKMQMALHIIFLEAKSSCQRQTGCSELRTTWTRPFLYSSRVSNISQLFVFSLLLLLQIRSLLYEIIVWLHSEFLITATNCGLFSAREKWRPLRDSRAPSALPSLPSAGFFIPLEKKIF